MRILITNHHLIGYGGTEVVTYELAKVLTDLGHEVFVYSPFPGKMSKRIKMLGIPVYDDLSALKHNAPVPEIIHAHHNITAIQARSVFPGAPMVYLSHGTIPAQEQPPSLDINISRFLAVSEEVRDNLVRQGVSAQRVAILRNFSDPDRFAPTTALRDKPRNVLVLSNYFYGQSKEIIEEACRKTGVRLSVIGAQNKAVWKVERQINKADLVITLGKGVLESMSCGRAVIVFGMSVDSWWGDGMVTKDNVSELAKNNFSGRRYKRKFDVDGLVAEVERYDPEMGQINRGIVVDDFNIGDRVRELVGVYTQAAGEFVPSDVAVDPRELNFYQSELQSSYLRLDEYRKEVRELCAKCDGLKAQCREFAAETESQRETIQDLSGQIEQMRNSLSWRLTIPVRSTGKFLRGKGVDIDSARRAARSGSEEAPNGGD